jgi:hypothetical protein
MIDRDIPKGPIGFGVLIIELQGVKVLAACAVGTWVVSWQKRNYLDKRPEGLLKSFWNGRNKFCKVNFLPTHPPTLH